MVYVLGALAFIVVLMLIVTIHEMGHFLMAKRANILCFEFSLGMGPLIFRKKWKETYFSVRAIPIGGFVSPAGEDGDQDFIQDDKRVRLVIENGRVKRIIHDIDLEKHLSLPLYNVVSHDLYGTTEGLDDELYLEVTKAENFRIASLSDEEKSQIKEGMKIKLLFEDGEFKNIIFDIDNPEYNDLPIYKVLEASKNEDPASITVELVDNNDPIKLIVNRDCIVEFSKKEEYQIAPKTRSMSSKTVGQRFLTIFGGPVMNFILAIIIYFVIGLVQGYPLENKTLVSSIDNTAPVHEILEEGDELLKINDESLSKWSDISEVLSRIAKGTDASFNGVLSIEYKNKKGEIKKALVAPIISVYSIEMVLDVDASSNGKIIVGEYSQNNTKTKSYKAGLRKGDEITAIMISGNKKVELNSINDLLMFFTSLSDAKNLEVFYKRGTEELSTMVESYSKDLLASQSVDQTKVQLGISPKYGFDFGKLLYMPFVNTGKSCLGIFKTLGLLFTDSSVHIDDFSGPVGIFQLISSTVSAGLLALLSLTAFLSVNIGFVNLLPLPALDGGRLVFIIIEAITKKKPSAKVENIVHTIGFILLMGLFVFISFNDVLRLFGCK